MRDKKVHKNTHIFPFRCRRKTHVLSLIYTSEYCVREPQAFCKFDFLVATSEPSLRQMPQQEIMRGTMHERTKVGRYCVYLVLSDAHKRE